MQYKQLTALIAAAAVLAACASDKPQAELDYQSVNKRVVSLDIPPDLNNPGQGNRYAMPGSGAVRASDLDRAKQQAAANGGSTVLSHVGGMKIEREGGERWLHIGNRTPAQLWPQLHAFWREQGFVIAREEPAIGLMETDWAENRAKLPNDGLRRLFDSVGLGGVYSTGERDKFIVRLERGGNGGTDVFISHRGMKETYADNNKDTTMWQPAPRDTQLEAAFLGRLMQHFGADEQTARRQLAENRRDTSADFAALENGKVVIRGSSERTWRRVGLALDRIGLNVVSENSQRGAYLVQVAPSEGEAVRTPEKPGFFGRLFGRESRPAPVQNLPEFVVVLTTQNNGNSVLTLNNKDGSPYQGRDAQTWLTRIYHELR